MCCSHQFWHKALYKEMIEAKRRKEEGGKKYKGLHVVASSNSVTTKY